MQNNGYWPLLVKLYVTHDVASIDASGVKSSSGESRQANFINNLVILY